MVKNAWQGTEASYAAMMLSELKGDATVTFKVPPYLKEQIRIAAEANSMNMTEWLTRAVEKAFHSDNAARSAYERKGHVYIDPNKIRTTFEPD